MKDVESLVFICVGNKQHASEKDLVTSQKSLFQFLLSDASWGFD